ncbi:unnamed protein product, partial [Ectocarpus sp. 12 AP-2014]
MPQTTIATIVNISSLSARNARGSSRSVVAAARVDGDREQSITLPRASQTTPPETSTVVLDACGTPRSTCDAPRSAKQGVPKTHVVAISACDPCSRRQRGTKRYRSAIRHVLQEASVDKTGCNPTTLTGNKTHRNTK